MTQAQSEPVDTDTLARLSHRLRTPLHAIAAWVHLLRRRGLPAEAGAGLDAIERNAMAAGWIISDLVDLARLQAGQLVLAPGSAAPAALVAGTLADLRPDLDERRLRVEADTAAATEPALLDPARFQQVLRHLLANAIQHSPPGACIGVRLARSGTDLVLEVGDEGEGIDPAVLAAALHGSPGGPAPRAGETSGLGVGLPLVAHLVRLQGGTVAAESEGWGSGTRVRVVLPVAAPPAAA